MNLSHGIDIVSVRRIRQSIARGGEAFLNRVYTAGERAYCQPRARRFEHYAARFAAKEAFMKALGDHVISLAFNQIEIKKKPSGKPYVSLSKTLLKRAGLSLKAKIDLSLSHDHDLAIASVVIIQ